MTTVDIRLLAERLGLSVELRSNSRADWSDVLDRCSYAPVNYTHCSIEYQWAYRRGHGGDWRDLSVILYWNNKPVAVWPLSLADVNGKAILGSHGLPMLPPLFSVDCPASSCKRITKSCLDLADEIAAYARVTAWQSHEPFIDACGLSDWYVESMARDAKCQVFHEILLDLRPEMAAIKQNFRKSYKALITSGLRLWRVDVLTSADNSIWDEFCQLHLQVAGRKTRSDETWALHLRDIGLGQGMLVYLRNESGQMIGAGFFNFTRDEGVYAVAAYDRTLFDKPLGHVVQYRAVEELKRRGVRWYKIGLRPFKTEAPAPTDKEISIGEFKQGFASHLIPRLVLTHANIEAVSQRAKGKTE
jgi:FemAB family protein